MLRFLLVLPVAFLFAWEALIFESTGFALLSVSVVVFAVLSFLLLLWQQRKVDVRLGIPMKVAERGQKFQVRADILNRNIFPVGKVQIFLAYGENQLTAREKRRVSMEDVPRGESVITEIITIHRSGYYEFLVKRVRIYDPFGIFYVSIRRKAKAHSMILPKLEEVPVKLGEGVKHFYGETMDYDEDQPGMDPSEVFGIREFHDGDKLQRIHWKLSARTEKLMVKEDSLPKGCAIVLFMPEGTENNGRMLDYMASLSFTLMDAKCAHYVAWQSSSRSDVLRLRVDDEESFYVALTTYMQDVSAQKETELAERYREKYKGEQYLHSVCAFADGTLMVDGEVHGGREHHREELFLR